MTNWKQLATDLAVMILIFIALTIVGFAFESKVQGQDRIFHASPIDAEQNARIASVEKRLDAIENRPVVLPVAIAVDPAIDPLTGYRATGPTVLMITMDRCSWCDKWRAKYPAGLRQVGWNVPDPIAGDFAGVTIYPTFRIYNAGKWVQHNGYMSNDKLREKLGLRPATQLKMVPLSEIVTQSAKYSTDELRDMIHAMRPGGWQGPVYADVQPRSSAKQHLVGPEHGFSWDQVSSLTQSEALILHDLAPRHGNKIFPYRSGQAMASRKPEKIVIARAFGNGCPSGGCAEGTRQQIRRRFFGWNG